jgi:hypothetical protein
MCMQKDDVNILAFAPAPRASWSLLFEMNFEGLAVGHCANSSTPRRAGVRCVLWKSTCSGWAHHLDSHVVAYKHRLEGLKQLLTM